MRKFLLVISALLLTITPLVSLSSENIEQYDPRSGFSKLIQDSSPAIVNISIIQDLTSEQFPLLLNFEELLKNLIEGKLTKKEIPHEILSAGSGFVIDKSGIIVTNYHVVQNAKEIFVTFSDNKSVSAKLLGTDPQTDLAVLKVDVKQKLPCLSFGDSNSAKVGDWVVAIGNPFGLGGSASIGIISARARDLNIGATEFLQTDAAINSGNSGGPLFNIHGEVIGINTAIISTQRGGGSIGVGFAIPSNSAVPIIEVLSQGKKVEHGWLGIVMQPITEELIEPFKLKEAAGVLVTTVIKDSPASKAALLPGDVILEFNSNKITAGSQLYQSVLRSKPESDVNILISRNGKLMNLTVKIGKLEDHNLHNQDNQINQDVKNIFQSPELGLTVGNIESNMIPKCTEIPTGVIVLKTENSNDAPSKNLRKGDIISQINQLTITSISDFKHAIRKASKNKSIALLVHRDGFPPLFIPIKMKKK
ncbi:Do family serine endopeptidase [Ehrlichia ruminantium]|uniref:Probable periplasmic serine endoprotease DegP-like n=1 Tax=Ehrlichia ruminantium TaxID=779 RepID=A0AAE6QAN9_EHRRU|nr:Do family serine endopeptidase [Ehrlichia ruminantium]QGR02874.1 Do family serine endopeptidase [Ehrlichia ruminantium]QGR03799.1 Do family serine endopeptidase [Ehrlichia ruminantium]QGR04726.1 Do family serine endopeptidase [Ehrlichia ruminantium]